MPPMVRVAAAERTRILPPVASVATESRGYGTECEHLGGRKSHINVLGL